MNYVSRSPFDIGRRTTFWEPARGRRVWLGQTPTAYSDPDDRLLNLTLMEILKRRYLAVLREKPEGMNPGPQPERKTCWRLLYDAGWPNKLTDFGSFGNPNSSTALDCVRMLMNGVSISGGANPSYMQDSAIKTIFEASIDPKSREIEDVRKLDAFFGPGSEPGLWDPLSKKDEFLVKPCRDGFTVTDVKPFGEDMKVVMDGDFWCSPWAKGSESSSPPGIVLQPSPWITSRHGVPYGFPGRAGFYGFTLDERLGDVELWLKNAALADYVLWKYPFPQPFGSGPGGEVEFWLAFALPSLREFVKTTAVPLQEEDIRVWITFSILANYKDMVAELNQSMKDQVRDEKRAQLTRTVAFALVGIVLGIAVILAELPAIIASIGGSVASAMNKIDAHDLQVQMSKIQDAFKESDPAFSEQVGEAAAYVQRLSAALETAVDKENVTRTLTSPKLSTGLLIGGGLAAIGALALAIFRK